MPVVEGAGGMSGGASFGDPARSTLGKVEQAMVDAIKKAQAEGITDPKVIQRRIKNAADYAAANG